MRWQITPTSIEMRGRHPEFRKLTVRAYGTFTNFTVGTAETLCEMKWKDI